MGLDRYMHYTDRYTQGVCRALSRSLGKSEEEDSSYLEEGDQQWLLMAHQGAPYAVQVQ